MSPSLLLDRPSPIELVAGFGSLPLLPDAQYRHGVIAPSTDDPELALRDRFVAGDRDVVRDLYDHHGPAVYTFAKRAVGPELARDLTQDVFLSAWRARSSYNPSRGSLGGWLMGIMKNRLIDSYRKAGRRVDEAELSEPVQQRAASEDHHRFGQLADRMVLTAALNSLPERQREVLTLAFWGDRTQQQIAEETNQPLGTVKSDMRRGLLRLRAELERNDV
ncbi:MAG: RNA polymerase sigma factor [Acidimicrobiales bacterium]|nr:RNA polymerase sigma factor [Acidimicrobiales bacterium]